MWFESSCEYLDRVPDFVIVFEPTKTNDNTEQVCKSYWNSISTLGIWESTQTDDVSINSDNMSCVSVESTNEIEFRNISNVPCWLEVAVRDNLMK